MPPATADFIPAISSEPEDRPERNICGPQPGSINSKETQTPFSGPPGVSLSSAGKATESRILWLESDQSCWLTSLDNFRNWLIHTAA
jgi:hypothetical protein